jgi:sigma-B regulation protein RsbU (phosphoserine phosphatase)
LVIGGLPGAKFKNDVSDVPPGSRLYVFSDGVYEITKPDGSMMHLDELVDELVKPAPADGKKLEAVLEHARQLNGSPQFEDDYSMLEITFA